MEISKRKGEENIAAEQIYKKITKPLCAFFISCILRHIINSFLSDMLSAFINFIFSNL